MSVYPIYIQRVCVGHGEGVICISKLSFVLDNVSVVRFVVDDDTTSQTCEEEYTKRAKKKEKKKISYGKLV